MLLSPKRNGLTSLFKEVRVFKGFDLWRHEGEGGGRRILAEWVGRREGTLCHERPRPSLMQNFGKRQGWRWAHMCYAAYAWLYKMEKQSPVCCGEVVLNCSLRDRG